MHMKGLIFYVQSQIYQISNNYNYTHAKNYYDNTNMQAFVQMSYCKKVTPKQLSN